MRNLHISTPNCPNCAYSFTSPTRLRWYEWPGLLLLRRPYRCRTCELRYSGRFYVLEYLAALLRDRVL